ncbi:hypothetical protein DO97_02820 [Neosynechococcus sphagnicola sy1]|uniref:Uncharacterized protein n=1 Tax=Neosynechococcus sphagnicola sy1 TaxID=1497020 RepID=A0A098TL37_9CYAN|nr:hypothetical protein DO97_02820 [Neosynechococcus sphagnicola sy1]
MEGDVGLLWAVEVQRSAIVVVAVLPFATTAVGRSAMAVAGEMAVGGMVGALLTFATGSFPLKPNLSVH